MPTSLAGEQGGSKGRGIAAPLDTEFIVYSAAKYLRT